MPMQWRHLWNGNLMSTEQARARTEDIVAAAADILFECPACGKSLVVDESAEGLIVDCPQCRTNVIVPPKSASASPAAAGKEESKPGEEDESHPASGPPRNQLAAVMDQLKEIQTQRTEVTNRIAARLNDVNRDLVMLARLGTSQQQVLSEWMRLVEKTSPERPTVIGASVTDVDQARVSPRK